MIATKIPYVYKYQEYYKVSISQTYDEMLGLNNIYFGCKDGIMIKLKEDIPEFLNDDVDILEIQLGKIIYEDDKIVYDDKYGIDLLIKNGVFIYNDFKFKQFTDVIERMKFDYKYSDGYSLKNTFLAKHYFTIDYDEIYYVHFIIKSGSLMIKKIINFNMSLHESMDKIIQSIYNFYKKINNIAFYSKCGNETLNYYLKDSNTESFVIIEGKYKKSNNIQYVVNDYIHTDIDIVKKYSLVPIINTKKVSVQS